MPRLVPGIEQSTYQLRRKVRVQHELVTVIADSTTSAAMRLRDERLVDPPSLLALPDLEPASRLAAGSGCPAISARGHRGSPETDGSLRSWRNTAGQLGILNVTGERHQPTAALPSLRHALEVLLSYPPGARTADHDVTVVHRH